MHRNLYLNTCSITIIPEEGGLENLPTQWNHFKTCVNKHPPFACAHTLNLFQGCWTYNDLYVTVLPLWYQPMRIYTYPQCSISIAFSFVKFWKWKLCITIILSNNFPLKYSVIHKKIPFDNKTSFPNTQNKKQYQMYISIYLPLQSLLIIIIVI